MTSVRPQDGRMSPFAAEMHRRYRYAAYKYRRSARELHGTVGLRLLERARTVTYEDYLAVQIGETR